MRVTPVDLQAELIALFRDALNIDVPAADTDLIATGRLDSMGMIELLLNLERRYGIRIDLQTVAIERFKSVNAIAELVAQQHANGTGHSTIPDLP